MKVPRAQVAKNRCTAKSSQTGEQCKKAAVLGVNVCRSHGAAAPQVKAAAKRRLELAMITPDRTLLEIARVAYGDVAAFFNTDGTIKKPHELNDDQRALLAGFEASTQNISASDGKQDLVHKVKAWDKVKALELLARHFKLLGEDKTTIPPPIEVSVKIVNVAKVLTGKQIEELEQYFNSRLNAHAPGIPGPEGIPADASV